MRKTRFNPGVVFDKLLVTYAERFPVSVKTRVVHLAEISKWLREKRELAFWQR